MKLSSPPGDQARVQALRDYGVLDGRPDPAFDDLTVLAANICEAPISMLGLVDSDRVWFKSNVGLDVTELPREGSFCSYAITAGGVFIVPDVLEDNRFASNPLLEVDSDIRFYAGAPLMTGGGLVLGALGVLDRRRRALSKQNQKALERLVGQAVDQLELRRTKKAFAQSERRFRAIRDEAHEAYISFETSGVIREWNREAERLLGWTHEEVIGASVRDTILPADLWDRVVAGIAGDLGSEEDPLVSMRVDATALTKAGKEIPVEFTLLPLRVYGETRINVLLHDISARVKRRVKREKMLLKTEHDAGVVLAGQNEQLRELDVLKNQFVSVVSHELRTPLTSIRGYLEIVLGEEPGPLNDEQRRFLQIVDSSSEQLLRVIGDLLLIGKVKAGHLGLEMSEISLASILHACIVAARPASEAKQIGLTLAEGNAPTITGDGGRVSQALGNIISNAIKFTNEGRIDIRLYAEGEWAVVEVKDTGTGVPKAEIEHLFVPFFRASTGTHNTIPGTGLGLSIAKEIIEAHGGTISVKSEEGVGTTFRVELPRKRPERLQTDEQKADRRRGLVDRRHTPRGERALQATKE